jgi:hypothetical protein
MTDLQKVLTLHDYFCNIARYPSDAQSNDKESYHSAYGIFYDGDTVCAGYTLAFSTVLKRLGIESEYVVSESMQHAWNAVKIDGNWYNVDLTYDDIGYYGDYSTDGAMHHRCFLKSNEALASEIGFYHYDMQTYDDVDCSDTTYDDYFWDDVDTNIVVIDNYYYYLKPNYSTRYASLVKRDAQGNEQTVFASAFKFTYQSLTSSCTDEEGTTHDVKFYEPFLRMVYLDDKIYISAYTQLYSVDSNNKLNNILNTGVATVANLILGLNVINNELAYQNYTSTGDRTALDKYQYFDKCFKVDGDSVYNNYPDVNNDGCVNAKDYALIKQQTSDN